MGVGTDPAVGQEPEDTLDAMLKKRAARALEQALDDQERIRREREDIPKRRGGKRNITVREERIRQARLDTEATAVDERVRTLLAAANQYLQTRQSDHLIDILKPVVGPDEAAYIVATGKPSPGEQVRTAENVATAEGRIKNQFAREQKKDELLLPRQNYASTLMAATPGLTQEQANQRAATHFVSLSTAELNRINAETARLRAEATTKKLVPGSPEDLEYKGVLADLEVQKQAASRALEVDELHMGVHKDSPRSANAFHSMVTMNLGMTNATLQSAWSREQSETESRYGKETALAIRNATGGHLPSSTEEMLKLQQTIGGKLDVPPEDFVPVMSGAKLRSFGITTPGEFFRQVGIGLLTHRLRPEDLDSAMDFFLHSDIARDQLEPGASTWAPSLYVKEMQAAKDAFVKSYSAIYGGEPGKRAVDAASFLPGASSEDIRKLQYIDHGLYSWLQYYQSELERIARGRGFQAQGKSK